MNLRRFAQKSDWGADLAAGGPEFRETKRRKLSKSLSDKHFSADPEFLPLFHMTAISLPVGVQGLKCLWKTRQPAVLRVLEVNTLEPLVKNVNATAQPYGARLSGRQGEVLREPR
ncbi:hypothetical protein [Burkholderia sp. BCC0097]|uniref:hypothetical protein n=1 Tax=Burkholderia sp. BCC0097 TaxID=2676289 RepID=UPI001588AEE6|nr:hypothetical protein [Burkholderia sp. BCC0097]